MKLSNVAVRVLIGVCLSGGIVCTTTTPASAQETSLSEAKDRTRRESTSAEASLAYGRALRRAGHESEALTELRRGQIFAKDANAILVEWEIARTHIAKRDFGAAMASCASLKKLSNGAFAQRVCAAEAHLLWRRGTEALVELNELAKQTNVPADVQYFAKIAEGRARELDSKDAEAEAAYKEAIRLAPSRDEAQIHLGALLQRTGRDGLSALRRAVELDPRDPIAQYELGRVLGANPLTRSEGITALEKAIAERPTYVEAYRSLTESYIAANRMADAKKAAASVLKLAPNDVFAHVVSGRVALADGKADDALKEGETALKLMPNEGKAKLLVADAYAKKGEIDLALEAYQKASGLDPLDPAPLVNATYACLAANRLTSAKAFGQRAVLDFPGHAGAWIAQGDALSADGNPKAAKTAYESARKIAGADVALIDSKLAKLK